MKGRLPIVGQPNPDVPKDVHLVGRYALVEWLSTAFVIGFTVTTLIAIVALQSTSHAITAAQLAEGFTFQLPANLATAFGAFGLT